MKKKIFWLSFDLGIKGDYNGMYYWLDSHHAFECGDSVAVFKFNASDKGFINEIKKDLEKHVKLNPTDRVYLLWRDERENKSRGRFIFGARRTPPWAGYAPTQDSNQEDY